ncbi:MAG: hypothetical protein AAGJ82_13200 [Bacteroidota bacterium]
MSQPVKVIFLSTMKNPDRKWYESPKLLDGAVVAERMEQLINDQLHSGYRFLNSMIAFEKPGDYGIKPSGMYLYFERSA